MCIFRVANEFGKWCPPNLNSVVATFCENIASGKSISVDNPDAPLRLMHIDDIVDRFISGLEGYIGEVFGEINAVYNITVGELANILQSFYEMRNSSNIPDMQDELTKKLYSTYLSFIPAVIYLELEKHTG